MKNQKEEFDEYIAELKMCTDQQGLFESVLWRHRPKEDQIDKKHSLSSQFNNYFEHLKKGANILE